jgi:putative ABC transport system permease protein
MKGVGTTPLLRRHVLADRGAGLTVVVVVLVVSILVAVWPRFMDRLFTQELRAQIAEVAPASRDLVANQFRPPPLAEGEADPWSLYRNELARVRDGFRPALQAATGAAQFHYEFRTALQERGPTQEVLFLRFRAAPHMDDLIEIVEGMTPGPFEVTDDDVMHAHLVAGSFLVRERAIREGQPIPDPDDLEEVEPVEVPVMMSVAVAERMGWEVGEVRQSLGFFVRLTGLFDAADADAPTWAHHPVALQPGFFDDGDRRRELTSAVYVDAGSIPDLVRLLALSSTSTVGDQSQIFNPRTRTWFPVDGATLDHRDGAPLLAAIRAVSSGPVGIADGGAPDRFAAAPFTELRFSSTQLPDVVARTVGQQSASAALIALVAAGPLGAAAAALALGSRLVADRRRPGLALARARGASPTQARMVLVAEGLLLGVPAAVAGLAVAQAVIPAAGGWLIPLLVGLAPVVFLLAVPLPDGLRQDRHDLDVRSGSRHRWVVEVLIVAAAAVASVLLVQRGLTATAREVGVDPLLAATPLLLALATAVVVLRLHPLPLRPLARAMHARPDVIPWLGPARAVRTPAGGLGPALALVVGLAAAVFSTVLWSTTLAGADQAAWDRVGADIRVTGPPFGEEQVRDIQQLPGVVAVVAVHDTGPARYGPNLERASDSIRVFAVDGEALARVHEGVPGTPTLALPQQLVDGRLPIVHAPGVRTDGDDPHFVRSQVRRVTSAGVARSVPGVVAGTNWALVDVQAMESMGLRVGEPRALLIRQDGDGVDLQDLQLVVGDDATILTQAASASAVREGPLAGGMTWSFVVAAVLAAALAGLAVVLALVIGAPTRTRVVAQLRTLGLTARQGRALTAWEILPATVMAVVAGLVLGLLMPRLIVQAVDLRQLTAGTSAPPLVTEAGLIAAIVAGFVVLVVVAVLLAARSGRRLRLATVLRIGDDT